MHAVVMTNAVTILIGLGLRYDVVEDGRPGFRAGAVTWYTEPAAPANIIILYRTHYLFSAAVPYCGATVVVRPHWHETMRRR